MCTAAVQCGVNTKYLWGRRSNQQLDNCLAYFFFFAIELRAEKRAQRNTGDYIPMRYVVYMYVCIYDMCFLLSSGLIAGKKEYGSGRPVGLRLPPLRCNKPLTIAAVVDGSLRGSHHVTKTVLSRRLTRTHPSSSRDSSSASRKCSNQKRLPPIYTQLRSFAVFERNTDHHPHAPTLRCATS